MPGDYEHVGVMASCRCYAQLTVHRGLLQPEKLDDLKAEIIRQIDQEAESGGPGSWRAWEPESFCDQTDIYLTDQEREIEEPDTRLLDRVREAAAEARGSALKREILKILGG